MPDSCGRSLWVILRARGQIRTDSAKSIVLRDVATSSGGFGVGEINSGSKLSVKGQVSVETSYYWTAAPTDGMIGQNLNAHIAHNALGVGHIITG